MEKVITGTHGRGADLREVTARDVTISFRNRNYFVPECYGFLLYFYFCEYGGVSNVVSNGFLHTMRPFEPYL